MNQKTISTAQPLNGETAGAAVKLLISRYNVPTVLRMDGFMNGVANTQYWVMFFSGTAVPANTTKPLFQLQVVGVNGFSWDFGADGGLDFTDVIELPAGTVGLIAAVSSTADALTASAQTMSLSVTVGNAYLPVVGASIAGDLTTGVSALTVWSAGVKSLYSLEVYNNGGVDAFAMVFSHSPVANDIPLATRSVLQGAKVVMSFGDSGLLPYQKVAGVDSRLCYVGISTDATKYVGIGGANFNIRASYK